MFAWLARLLPLLQRTIGSQATKDILKTAAPDLLSSLMSGSRGTTPPPSPPPGNGGGGGNSSTPPPPPLPPGNNGGPGRAAQIGQQLVQPENLQSLLLGGQLLMQMLSYVRNAPQAATEKLASSPAARFVQNADPQKTQVIRESAGLMGEGAKAGALAMFGGLPGQLMAMRKWQDIAADLPSKLEKWGEALTESQRTLQRFNGTLAASFRERERRDILRQTESAANTAGSTRMVNEQLADLKDAVQPLRDTVTNAANLVVASMTMLITPVIDLLTTYLPLISPVAAGIDWLASDRKNSQNFFNEFSSEVERADRNRDEPVNSRRRVPPRPAP